MFSRYIKFFSFLFLIFIFSCETDENEVNRITRPAGVSPVMISKNVDVDYRDSGLVVLKMQAARIKQFQENVPEPYYEADKGLKVLFFDKAGKQISMLSANYGVYYERSQKVEVRYKVVVENAEGKRLETEKLTWKKNDSIRSEGQVIMWEKNRKLIGKNLVATEDFSHMELNDISAILPIEEISGKQSESKPEKK